MKVCADVTVDPIVHPCGPHRPSYDAYTMGRPGAVFFVCRHCLPLTHARGCAVDVAKMDGGWGGNLEDHEIEDAL